MEELFQFPSFTHTLQVTGCHFGRKPPGWTYPLHHHHLFELVYCFRGEVEQEISRERLLLREGDWLLIKAGVRHQLANRSEAEYGYFNVHFDLDDDGIRGLLAAAPYRHFTRKETEGSKLTSYVKELEQVRDRSRKDPSSGQAGGTDETVPLPFGDLLLLQAYTLLLLHELLALLREDRPSRPKAAAAQTAGRGGGRAAGRGSGRSLGRSAASASGSGAPAPDQGASPSLFAADLAHEVEERLALVMSGEESVAGVAKELNLSRSQCSKLFAKVYGLSPQQYVSRQKLKLAKELLVTTNLPMTRIAERLGFQSASHFSRQFRRWTGQSPTEFRPKHLAGTVADEGADGEL